MMPDIDHLYGMSRMGEEQGVMLREIAKALCALVEQNRYAYFSIRTAEGFDLETRVERSTGVVEHFILDYSANGYIWKPANVARYAPE